VEREFGISASTISRIFKENKLRTYKMTLHQELTNTSVRRRLEFCNWIRQQSQNFHYKILFSDESTFKSDGSVNTYNCRYWTQENPHWFREIYYQRVWKVNVLCGIIDRHIVAPFFFEDNLTGIRPVYANFIENDLQLLLENIPLQLRQIMWFQQDGCPAHSSRVDRLNHMFRG